MSDSKVTLGGLSKILKEQHVVLRDLALEVAELRDRVEGLYGFEQNQRVLETPEYAEDILVASINALYNQRSQGALTMARQLEEKYFEGRDMQQIGDRLTRSGDLYTATKKEGES